VNRWPHLACATLLVASTLSLPASAEQDAAQARPTFHSTVDLVTIAAVVRDKHGRFARDLQKSDFVVEEGGRKRDIVDFHADDNAPVRVALLFDVSGSMRVADRIQTARNAARQVMSSLRLGSAGGDEAAVFAFDMNLLPLQSFTSDPAAIEQALARVAPYGQTSLYDAIAQAARRVADAPKGDAHRRAVVVLTDGVDTSSEMRPEEVSAIASAIDVPVYVVTVVSDVDRGDVRGTEAPQGPLRDLARATGGEMFVTSAPAHQSIAARQIVDELRHEYVLAFDAVPASGWRPLDVRTKNKDLIVRARSGYSAGAPVESW
jgi:VWFA-related protein